MDNTLVKGVTLFLRVVKSVCVAATKGRHFFGVPFGVRFFNTEENKLKKIVIAGCRYYNNYKEAKEYIDFCISEIRKQYSIVIVSGGCSGADMIGEKYAEENSFQVERYPADWDKYGRSAGPIRNRQMAEICDYVICFWDGKSRGTKSMIEYAKKIGKPVMVKMI